MINPDRQKKHKSQGYLTLVLIVLIYGSIIFGVIFDIEILTLFGVSVSLFLIFYSLFLRLIDKLLPVPEVMEIDLTC
ncbi:MAG: hypothetical protein ACW99A_24030, partial [Candidatus Kariarchaeaceae archaeon]